LAGLGYFGWRRFVQSRDLAEARAAVGSRSGGQVLSKFARSYPDNAEMAFLYGRHLRMEGRIDEAITHLIQAGDKGWNGSQVDRELLLARSQTDIRLAEPGLLKLLNQNPQDDEILLAMSLGYSRQLNAKKAEILVESVLERRPNDGLARCLRGRIMLQRGQPHMALPDLEEACRLGADRWYYPEARLLLANCLLDVGRFEESLHAFRESREEEPDNLKILLGEARCHWFLDQWDQAAKMFREILRIDPNHLDALSQLAYICEERGELDEARRLLERAAKVDTTWAELSFRLVKVLNALGETDRAGAYLKQAEKMKNQYAKPRTSPFTMNNSYTGEQTKSLRGSSGP
jgi:tetratricopeptide (TPR) repeat protein